MKTTAVACLLMVAIAGSADAVSCLPCLAVFLGLPHYRLAVLMHTYLYLSEKTTGNFRVRVWPDVVSESEAIPTYLVMCRPGNMAAKPLLALRRLPVR